MTTITGTIYHHHNIYLSSFVQITVSTAFWFCGTQTLPTITGILIDDEVEGILIPPQFFVVLLLGYLGTDSVPYLCVCLNFSCLWKCQHFKYYHYSYNFLKWRDISYVASNTNKVYILRKKRPWLEVEKALFDSKYSIKVCIIKYRSKQIHISGQQPVAGSCERGTETSGSLKVREFLE